jgi:hypothetical protein
MTDTQRELRNAVEAKLCKSPHDKLTMEEQGFLLDVLAEVRDADVAQQFAEYREKSAAMLAANLGILESSRVRTQAPSPKKSPVKPT